MQRGSLIPSLHFGLIENKGGEAGQEEEDEGEEHPHWSAPQ